ncbi:hypothetical protein KJZ61_00750 [Candidatus Dependentiae bacterium]|nr:hypothetical protein [Candidatus Dependentiae bacterium]
MQLPLKSILVLALCINSAVAFDGYQEHHTHSYVSTGVVAFFAGVVCTTGISYFYKHYIHRVVNTRQNMNVSKSSIEVIVASQPPVEHSSVAALGQVSKNLQRMDSGFGSKARFSFKRNNSLTDDVTESLKDLFAENYESDATSSTIKGRRTVLKQLEEFDKQLRAYESNADELSRYRISVDWAGIDTSKKKGGEAAIAAMNNAVIGLAELKDKIDIQLDILLGAYKSFCDAMKEK